MWRNDLGYDTSSAGQNDRHFADSFKCLSWKQNSLPDSPIGNMLALVQLMAPNSHQTIVRPIMTQLYIYIYNSLSLYIYIYMLCWFLMLWYRETHACTHKIIVRSAGIDLTTFRLSWRNIANCKLSSTFVPHPRYCAKSTVPMLGPRTTNNWSEINKC